MEQSDSLTHVVILGSTGSIGHSAMSVIEHDGGARLKAWGLSAQSRWKVMAEQAIAHRPRFVAVANPELAPLLKSELRGTGVEVLAGLDGVIRMVQNEETDRVLSAIVGAVGLRGTWAALEAGKTVALANKETLVVAGPLIMELANARGAQILPVDSEHSAIFQSLKAGAHGRTPRHSYLIRRPVSGSYQEAINRRDAGTGPESSHVADGPQDHHRLSNPHEQGA